MKRILLVLTALSLVACLTPAHHVHAQGQPIQLALFNPIQLVSEGQAIAGIRINLIYGKNTSITGIDYGLVNHTTSGMSTGAQFGFVGYNEANFTGWMDNGVNISKGSVKGVQIGVVNYTKSMNGVQFGLVNYTGTMEALQIGLVNIIEQGGAFPVFPIVNWSF